MPVATTQQAPTTMPMTAPPQIVQTSSTQPSMMVQQPQMIQPPQQAMQPVAAFPQQIQPQGMPAVAANATETSTVASINAASMNILPPGVQPSLTQLQADYSQRLNDFATQSKAVQDQLQNLNARVVNMESQLNQLVQTLLHQNPPSSAPPAATVSTSDSKIPYYVQAIIPGRAWLKADNGETVTVAEGDVIKDLGRVTKIDPYDGVVEVNTGSKVVSLSYGSGG